jgi:hypothetical protein
MSNVGSVDSSAAAWAEATLAAAESYAQAEADAAAEARDAAERNAANGSGDGVETSSAHQRALDAFWGHDPNRPASTMPGASGGSSPAGGSDGGGDGRIAVQLTPEEAKAFADAGMKVTSDGNGGYYLEATSDECDPGTQHEQHDTGLRSARPAAARTGQADDGREAGGGGQARG